MPASWTAFSCAHAVTVARVRQQVVLGAVLGQEDPHEEFQLQHGFLRRRGEPRRELLTPLGRDGVASARPLPGPFVGAGRESVMSQLVGLLVELAHRPRPEPGQAALHLPSQLVRGPRADGE